MLPFVNRDYELAELERSTKKGGLVVVFGRRRIGKTRLLRGWLDRHEGLYSRCINGTQLRPAFGA